MEVNGLDWQCCLAGSSQRAPRILIFSIAMGADYLFYVKTIETHARAFLTLYDLAIDRVWENLHTIEISTIAYLAVNLVKE